MSKVITFSTEYPKGHPSRRFAKTNFVESIWKSLTTNLGFDAPVMEDYPGLSEKFSLKAYGKAIPKKHTIRSGNRWEAGEYFSPRIWSGLPYRSKQIVIAPDLLIKRVADIEIRNQVIWINKKHYAAYPCWDKSAMMWLSHNDGLMQPDDMKHWFGNATFNGQIIIWDDTELRY